jgi:hypothetical protein
MPYQVSLLACLSFYSDALGYQATCCMVTCSHVQICLCFHSVICLCWQRSDAAIGTALMFCRSLLKVHPCTHEPCCTLFACMRISLHADLLAFADPHAVVQTMGWTDLVALLLLSTFWQVGVSDVEREIHRSISCLLPCLQGAARALLSMAITM